MTNGAIPVTQEVKQAKTFVEQKAPNDNQFKCLGSFPQKKPEKKLN